MPTAWLRLVNIAQISGNCWLYASSIESPHFMKKQTTSDARAGELFEKLSQLAIIRQYAKGEVIFSQGDAADAMFRVQEGNVKLAVASPYSKKAAVSILRDGDCFGEGCLVGKSLRRCTATSIQRSTIGRISRQVLIRNIREKPAFAAAFVSFLLSRIGRLEDDLVDQLMNTSERRLARLLVQLAGTGPLSGRVPGVVNIDQGTFAQVVGTTRSRVSHFMNQFRKQGFINYNGRLRVHPALLAFLLQSHDRPQAPSSPQS